MERMHSGIVGFYNEHGYRVCEMQGSDISDLYTAGNSRWDSTDHVDPKDKANAYPLDTIKQFCEQTTREMAEEQEVEYAGVEYEEYDGDCE